MTGKRDPLKRPSFGFRFVGYHFGMSANQDVPPTEKSTADASPIQSGGENASEIDDAEKFADVASGVYRRFDPETFAAAIRYAVARALPAENPTIMLMFVRIAEHYPAAVPPLRSWRDSTDGALRQAIDLILDPPPEIKQAAYLPGTIQSPGEMDLCWAEFLVTGETENVEKIIDVLDRDDRTRRWLDERLGGLLGGAADADFAKADFNDAPKHDAPKHDVFELDADKREALQRIGIVVGKSIDQTAWEIMTPGDTDLLLWLGVKNQDPVCSDILQSMDETLQIHIATKGAALWSLQANASVHGRVRSICQAATAVSDDSREPKTFGRKMLGAAL